MSENTQMTKDILEMTYAFLSANRWAITSMVIAFVFRTPLGVLIEKITKIIFKSKNSLMQVHCITEETTASVSNIKAEVNAQENISDSSQELIQEEKKEMKGQVIVKMIDAFWDGNVDDGKKLFDQHMQTITDLNTRIKDTALYHHLLYTCGNEYESISVLKELIASTEDDETRFHVVNFLTLSYSKNTQIEKNLELWQNERERTSNTYCFISIIMKISNCLQELERAEEARTLLLTIVDSEMTDSQRSELYITLASVEEKLGNTKFSAYCLDLATKYTPDSTSTLFKAAYAAKESNITSLAMANYTNLLSIDAKDSGALNNLGNIANENKFPIKKVSLYKASENNTLAMSNQSNVLLEAGFLDEAKELAEKAAAMDSPDPHVAETLKRIEEAPRKEGKAWKLFLLKAKKRQELIRKFTTAYYSSEKFLLDEEWVTAEGCTVSFTSTKDGFTAAWTEKKSADEEFSCLLNIVVQNLSCTAEFKRNSSRYYSILGSPNIDKKCLGYVTSNELVLFSENDTDEFTLTIRKK